MSKNKILVLILSGCIAIASLVVGINLKLHQNQIKVEDSSEENKVQSDDIMDGISSLATNEDSDLLAEEPWVLSDEREDDFDQSAETSDEIELNAWDNEKESSAVDSVDSDEPVSIEDKDASVYKKDEDISSSNIENEDVQTVNEEVQSDNEDEVASSNIDDEKAVTPEKETEEISDTSGDHVELAPDLQLIIDSSKVDYNSFLPDMIYDSTIETTLDIQNPDIGISAEAAILYDANTKEVLYYKNPVKAEFPASTSKVLTALVALDYCNEKDEVKVGNEVTMIAYDSSKAYLKKGQVLTFRTLLESMLLPSGNDAAYVVATYVGRKALQNPDATIAEAIYEFIRLMNEKAKSLGAVNSNFMTPDGYDAKGQYTTAYDLALVGLAALENDTILDVVKKSSARHVLISGEDYTWTNTNALIRKDSSRYYQYSIGLKTGTTTMAGRCIIAAARNDEKEVLCVILDSTSSGRWEDATTLLQYGLKQ